MSQEVDTVIAGGQLVVPQGITQAAIAIDGGRIVLVGRNDHMPGARERINAERLFVLPGAIDVHVHFREPGFSHKETWTSATQACVYEKLRLERNGDAVHRGEHVTRCCRSSGPGASG